MAQPAVHPGEDPAAQLRRVFLAQLRAARGFLASHRRLTDEDVHEARKSIKRARATLRLLRPSLDRASFRFTNTALRDVARPLTGARDAAVLLDTLSGLREDVHGAAGRRALKALEARLRREHQRERQALTGSRDAAALGARLRQIEAEARQWPLPPDDGERLAAALQQIQRRGRRAGLRALEEPSAGCLHEWRKQVKHFTYGLETLRPLRPGRIGALADQARRLGDTLGEDHDLAVLRERLGDAGQPAITAAIDARRAQLQDAAFTVGEALYRPGPRAFMRALGDSLRKTDRGPRSHRAVSAPAGSR